MSLTILFEHAIGERVYRVDEQAWNATLEAWRKAKEEGR